MEDYPEVKMTDEQLEAIEELEVEGVPDEELVHD